MRALLKIQLKFGVAFAAATGNVVVLQFCLELLRPCLCLSDRAEWVNTRVNSLVSRDIVPVLEFIASVCFAVSLLSSPRSVGVFPR